MMKLQIKVLLFLLLVSLPLGTAVWGETSLAGDYWPADNWRTSTPEEQGIDSAQIYSMLKCIKEKKNFHSVLIIRNGYLVTEAYFNPYHKGVKEDIISCTSSIMSALVGIALRDGIIKDIHQKVGDFFPGYTFTNPSERKKSITVENLLTMTTGLDWQYRFEMTNIKMMLESKDSLQFTLDLPMANDPGARFIYCTGASQILSAMIHEKYGKSTLDFAQEHLFTPLGITTVDWQADPKGVYWGGLGLSLTPSDMAKFGYLYLRQGVWNGKQLIPAAWVDDSTREHIRWEFHPNETIGYGYHWWRESFGFSARGWGGQCIYILPKYDMILVFTGETKDSPSGFTLSPLIEKYIIPAVKSDRPLPPNKKIAKETKLFLQEIMQPGSKPVPPLPAMAARISGKEIQCGPNKLKFKSFGLRFDEKKNCFITIATDHGNSTEYPVGLDGVYRNTISEKFGETAFKGAWILENTFLIDEQVLQQTERYYLKFTFDKDVNEVSIEVSGSFSGHLETIRGEWPE